MFLGLFPPDVQTAGEPSHRVPQVFRKLLVLVFVVVVSHKASAIPVNPLVLPADADLPKSATLKLDAPAPATAAPDPAVLNDRLKELAARHPAADFDPAERAKSLGTGLEPAFKFVRDNIRFESYPGVFRGAAGAYRSRAANAADRSLLLAEFLRVQGIQTRLATGHLAADKAQALFDRIFAADGPEQPAALMEGKKEMTQRIHDRAARDYATIVTALGDKLPASAATPNETVRAEIAQHVWVQAKVDGKWVDLDTAFSDSVPGKAYCNAEWTGDKLPDDAYQRLTFRIVVEKLEGNTLKPETALELTKRVVDLAERQIFVLHLPPDAMKGLGGSVGGGKDRWTPAVWIDGDLFPGKPVSFDEKDAAGRSPPKSGGGLDDVLGALDSRPAEPAAAPQFVAEILETDVVLPGGSHEVVRRMLVDRGGAAWRMTAPLDAGKLQPLARTDAGPNCVKTVHNLMVSVGPHDLSSYIGAVQLLAEVSGVMNRPATQPGNSPPSLAEQLWPMAIADLSCVLPGDQGFVGALNDDAAVRLYRDSPRISIFSISSLPNANGSYHVDSEIDWRRDKIRGIAKNRDGDAAVARRKIWYGVLEGAMEHEVGVQPIPGETAQTVVSTSGALDEKGVVVRPAGGPVAAWEQLSPQRETAALMAAAIGQGETLVMPRAAATRGLPAWWAISPQTGDTRAAVGNLNYVLRGGNLPPPPGGGSGGGGSFGNVGGRTTQIKGPQQWSPANRNRGGGGSEYTTLLENVSLPAWAGYLILFGGISIVVWVVVKLI